MSNPLKTRSFVCAAVTVFAALTSIAAGQEVAFPKDDNRTLSPHNPDDIKARYPAGKKWTSVSTLRAEGRASSTNWGLTGEQSVTIVNRYWTRTEVIENSKIGNQVTIKLQIDIYDAGITNIVSRSSLRLADFDIKDPLFLLAGNSGVQLAIKFIPQLDLLIKSGKVVEGADPKLRRTLTALGDRLGIHPQSLTDANDLELIERPYTYLGSRFEVTWDNQFGVTNVNRTPIPGSTAPKELNISQIRKWGANTSPLADLYLLPSLSKQPGERWSLDASKASSIFTGLGDTTTRGEIALHYQSDEHYQDIPARKLSVDRGNLIALVEQNDFSATYRIDSMSGELFVNDKDGMLIMAKGRGDIRFNRESSNHILFRSEITRDFKCQWRYEAELLN